MKRRTKQASIREKRTLHKKLRAKAKAKKAPKDAGISQSQDANMEESAGAIASAKETNKGRKKVAKSKLHDMKELVVSPQRSSEPQRKKRKIQKGPTATSAPQRTQRRSQEKPLGKPKAPREKGTNKS